MEWTNNYLKRCFRSLKEAAVIARLCTYQVPQKRSAILLTCKKKQNGVPVLAFKRYSKDTTQGEPMLWIWWCLEETALWKFAKEHFLRSLLQKNSRSGRAHVFSLNSYKAPTWSWDMNNANHSRGLYPTSNMKVDFFGGVSKGKMWVPFGRIP